MSLSSNGAAAIMKGMLDHRILLLSALGILGIACSTGRGTEPAPTAPKSDDRAFQTDEQIAQNRLDTKELQGVLERAVAKGKLEGDDRERVISFLRGPGPDQWALGGATLVSFARVSPQNAKDALELYKREVPKRAYEESPVLVPGTLKRLEELAGERPAAP